MGARKINVSNSLVLHQISIKNDPQKHKITLLPPTDRINPKIRAEKIQIYCNIFTTPGVCNTFTTATMKINRLRNA